MILTLDIVFPFFCLFVFNVDFKVNQKNEFMIEMLLKEIWYDQMKKKIIYKMISFVFNAAKPL